jgi:hypothetical protein
MHIGKSNALVPPHRREGLSWTAYAPGSPPASPARQRLVGLAGRHPAAGRLTWLTGRRRPASRATLKYIGVGVNMQPPLSPLADEV